MFGRNNTFKIIYQEGKTQLTDRIGLRAGSVLLPCFFCGGVAKVFLDGFGWRVHCLESLLESVVGCSYPGLVDRADLYHVRKIATIRFFLLLV